MLARYRIIRGTPPNGYRKPTGICQDTRYFTNHCLSPSEKAVKKYLSNPSSSSWKLFKSEYLKLLERNYKLRRNDFDELASLATSQDVYIGCSCPTKKNSDVYHCHTVLALKFMQKKYPRLEIEFPQLNKD